MPVQLGHLCVDEYHVRLQPFGLDDGLQTAARLTYRLQVGVGP